MPTSNFVIKNNNFKIYLCMGAMTFVIGFLGSIISYYFHWGLTGTGVCLIISGIINFVAYFFSDKLILRASGAKPIPPEAVPELYTAVQELCLASNLPMPKLYLINTDAMNAFATGRDVKHSAVAVTRGLLEKLDLNEVKGVVAHELSHIKNGDMRLMAVVSIVAGFISILADMYWHAMSTGRVSEKDRSGIAVMIGAVLSLFAPLTALFIQLAISRKREFVADASGAEMTKNPAWLASALKKISMDHRPIPSVGVSTAHLYISNPSTAGNLIDRLFSTHPPVEERIANLNSIEHNQNQN